VLVPRAAVAGSRAPPRRLDAREQAPYGPAPLSDSKARSEAAGARATTEAMRREDRGSSPRPDPSIEEATSARAEEGPAATGPASGPVAAARGADGVRAAPEPGQEGSDAPFLQLPSFEGPLDLLLHLIQQHELDILDIPVSFITQKYLEYLKLMRTLSIDVASEYLVMAATLTHIKSKMLLPSVPAGQEDDALAAAEEDPRAELVRRLLEYQKYKAAAAELGERSALGRDVFARGSAEVVPEGPAPFAPTPIFSLLDAFNRVLSRAKVRIDHEVVFDRISITDRIVQLTEKLGVRKAMPFEELFEIPVDPEAAPGERRAPSRFDLVITFLAVLEMARMKILRVYQSDPLAPIHVELAVQDGKPVVAGADEGPIAGAGDETPSDDDGGDGPPAAADAGSAGGERAPDRPGDLAKSDDEGGAVDAPAPGSGYDEGPAASDAAEPAPDPANENELPRDEVMDDE
jgi:segregation and condensation protein A